MILILGLVVGSLEGLTRAALPAQLPSSTHGSFLFGPVPWGPTTGFSGPQTGMISLN